MKIVKKAKEFEHEVKNRMFTAIAAAFALVIALSWNDFIKGVVTKIVQSLGLTNETWIFQLIAAVLTTIICVLGITYASRINGNNK
ncbi:hypothetical protein KY309_02960 [Candidatus Woesearchaeota archaeon]|nr:hypothetical protein [Candidatus Woesearchaeota archaeon]MBW3016546.1 hypothetical protein [Candidatus Woesearchaeota archaeon]